MSEVDVGGGKCTRDGDCKRNGKCQNGKCICRDDGVSAGKHCGGFKIQCPEYKNSACCSWQQNVALAENFQLIASLFGGNKKGGCDACAANLMILWCGIVCSPKQAEFMNLHLPYPSTKHIPDPLNGGKMAKVLEVHTLQIVVVLMILVGFKIGDKNDMHFI